MNHLPIQSTLSSKNTTRTFCNKSQQNKHRTSIVRPTRIWNDPHTLTNPNQQPYPKHKLNTDTAVKIQYVPEKNTATPTDITTDYSNNVPLNTANGLQPTNNVRPMHRTSGRTEHHRLYIH